MSTADLVPVKSQIEPSVVPLSSALLRAILPVSVLLSTLVVVIYDPSARLYQIAALSPLSNIQHNISSHGDVRRIRGIRSAAVRTRSSTNVHHIHMLKTSSKLLYIYELTTLIPRCCLYFLIPWSPLGNTVHIPYLVSKTCTIGSARPFDPVNSCRRALIGHE